MEISSLRAAIGGGEFDPVRIRLLSGAFVDVHVADSMFIHRRQLLVLNRRELSGHEIDDYRFLDIELVADVIPLRLADRAEAGPQMKAGEILLPSARVIAWLESLLALLATLVICLLVGVAGVVFFMMSTKGNPVFDFAALALWAAWLTLEVLFLIRVYRFYARRLYPLPLLYALEQEPPKRRVVGWLFAAVWIAHALVGISAFADVERFFSVTNHGRTTSDRLAQDLVIWTLVIAGAHASMMFVLLAARAVGATPAAVRKLWSFRVLIDVGIVALIALAPGALSSIRSPWAALFQNAHSLLGR